MRSVILLLVLFSADAMEAAPRRWGFVGHEMAATAAVAVLPQEMPAFFRDAGEQLVYLTPEPDRWRSRDLTEMDQAWSYDHYIDLENVPSTALEASDRFEFIAALYRAGLDKPEQDAGFMPFRIVEMYERLVTEWRMWRNPRVASQRGFIEDRIINDAGILAHYVTDASNPHHTTIHFNGWAEGSANPEGYTDDRDFHSRFERYFVEAHVEQRDVSDRVTGAPESYAGQARSAVMRHIQATHAEVETLYRLDRDIGFEAEEELNPETRDFAAERLAAGAEMLAALWWSAWLESASPAGGDR